MKLATLYSQLSHWPLGKWIFSHVVTFKAPYFASIFPIIQELTETKCIVMFKKRRRVQNHIGTMHAIAMCNACELAFGMTMEAGIAKNLRWIPKGMTVRYLKKGETDLTAICDFPVVTSMIPGDYMVPVKVLDMNSHIVMEADITVYISKKQ